MERTWFIKVLLLLLFVQTLNAQQVNLNRELNSLLFDFYSEIENGNIDNSLKLSKTIDSILLTKNELNIESLATCKSSAKSVLI